MSERKGGRKTENWRGRRKRTQTETPRYNCATLIEKWTVVETGD